VYALPSCVYTGDTITVDADSSYDPEGESPLMIEWDLNNDGVFDTTPSADMILKLVYDTSQVRAIRARLTDAHGYQSLSTVIGLRIKQKPPTEAGHNWPLFE
jgi:hypothetical protein